MLLSVDGHLQLAELRVIPEQLDADSAVLASACLPQYLQGLTPFPRFRVRFLDHPSIVPFH